MLHTTYKSDNIKIYKSDYIENLQQKKIAQSTRA